MRQVESDSKKSVRDVANEEFLNRWRREQVTQKRNRPFSGRSVPYTCTVPVASGNPQGVKVCPPPRPVKELQEF
jgi:hypothetical protein